LKLFISYSTKDKDLAERLFADMAGAGAEVFQYSKTAEAGKRSWTQVLSWIKVSDVFIVLVSQNALSSGPVAEEIEHALYWHVNSGRKKPARLISALIERDVQPPDAIAPYSRIDFVSYASDVGALMNQLGLKRPSVAPLLKPLPDFSTLWLEHKKANPKPSVESQWSTRAARIAGNYNRLVPPEITAEERIDHIDSILAEYAGKSDQPLRSPRLHTFNNLLITKNPFLGIANLPESLLNFSTAFQVLESPKLSTSDKGLEWSEVAGATAYILEYNFDKSFEKGTTETYRGPERKYFTILSGYYRVKAQALFRQDSPWSNSVYLPLGPLISFFKQKKGLSPLIQPLGSVFDWILVPLLSRVGMALNWTEVAGAGGYVLERSQDKSFAKTERIYEGTDRTYTLRNELFAIFQPLSYYRVKATGLIFGDSHWSNIVSSTDVEPLDLGSVGGSF
jgi:hypothetical protein